MAAVEAVAGKGIFMLSSFLAIWLRTIAILFLAIARYLKNGFRHMPTNFRRTLFVVDCWHPAELVPGYSGDFPNTGAELLRVTGWEGLSSKLFILMWYVILLIPAYLYRLSIKSTCWLYLPLVYIASERDFAWTSEHLIDRLKGGGGEWWRRILAVSTLIAFAVTTLASVSSLEFARATHEIVSPKIISPLEFMFQFDFGSVKWWQYCSLAGALITGWLFLEAKDIRVDIDHADEPKRQAAVTRQVDRVKLMMRVRNVLSVALILMVGVHALLAYSPVAPYLPAYILRGLGWFYGSYMPAIPTVP
jgi:hypothetical protein